MTLHSLRSHNKYPSKSSIYNSLNLYIDNFYFKDNPKKIDRVKLFQNFYKESKKKEKENLFPPFNITNNISMHVFPFDIQYNTNETKSKFDIFYDNTKNVLFLENLDLLKESEYNNSFYKNILAKFALSINTSLSPDEVLSYSENALPVYRGVNIYIWVDNESENKKTYEKYIAQISKHSYFLKSIGPLVIKFINYNKANNTGDSVVTNENLYSDIKQLNPKRLFNELNEKDLFNIHLLNDKNSGIKTFYNSDLNSFIFSFDFDMNLSTKTFKFITKQMSLINLLNPKEDLFTSYMTKDILDQLWKMYNTPLIQRHLKFIATLNNLEKISRIFPLYETILTVNKVKGKIEKSMVFLRNVVQSKFSDDSMKDLDEVYMDTRYLMSSNELVIFEHFFSDEFKIGQFLPITLPLLYGLGKSFKALTF